MMTRFRQYVQGQNEAFAERCALAWTIVTGMVGADEILLIVALVLVGAGCWQVWRPAGLIAPGLVLLWIAMPSRAAFIAPADEKSSRRKS